MTPQEDRRRWQLAGPGTDPRIKTIQFDGVNVLSAIWTVQYGEYTPEKFVDLLNAVTVHGGLFSELLKTAASNTTEICQYAGGVGDGKIEYARHLLHEFFSGAGGPDWQTSF